EKRSTGGDLSGAVAGDGGGVVGDSESRSSLCSVGSSVSTRAAGVDVTRCRSRDVVNRRTLGGEDWACRCREGVFGSGVGRGCEGKWRELHGSDGCRIPRLSDLHFRLIGYAEGGSHNAPSNQSSG